MEWRDRAREAKRIPPIVSKTIEKKGSEFISRNIWWEAPSIPTAANDHHLLPERGLRIMLGS